MTERIHLAVSGTRDADSRLENLVPRFVEMTKATVIHVGCARGVDAIVRRLYTCVVHQARWDDLGKLAGKARNEEMLDAIVAGAYQDVLHGIRSKAMLLAFPRDGGRGTQHCIQSALCRGLEVWEVPCDRNTWKLFPAVTRA